MAEKVVIAELDIDIGNVVKEQQDLGKVIKRLSEDLKEAKKTGDQYSETSIKNEANLRTLKKEYAANQRIIQGLNVVQKGNVQTVAESRLAVSALSAEWAKSAATFGEQDKRTVALQSKLTKLNEGLKKQEGAWGNNTRNVGGYEDAIAKATGGVNQLGAALPGAAKGSDILNKAFNLLKANPIILIITGLVLAIKGLIKIFSKNEASVDRYNKIMKQLGAIIDEITARVGKFFKSFKNLLTLDFKKFGEDVKASFDGITESINSAAAAAREIADLEVEIRKESIKIVEAQAQRRKEIAELIILTRDEAKSFEERRKALQQANALEVANLEEQLALQQKQVALAEKELAATPEFQRTDEQRLKVAQEKGKLLDLETASITRQRELLNRINELENKANATQKAALEAQRKTEEEALKVKEEAAKRSIELMDIELEAFMLANETKLTEGKRITDELFENEKSRMLEIAAQEQEINQARYDAALISKEEFELNKDLIDAAFREQRAALEEELKAQEQEAAMVDEENRLAAEAINILSDYDKKADALERERALEIANAKKTGADVTLINKKYDQAQVSLEAAKQNAKLSLTAQAAGNIASIFGEETAIGKAAAIAQTTISTYQAATGSYAALSSIVPAGPVLGALAAAAAIAAGIANVNKIRSTNVGSSGSISTPSISTPNISGGGGGGGTGSTGSLSTLGSSLTSPNSAIAAQQTQSIEQGMTNALENTPNVLVLEDFKAVEGRQVEVETEAEL